MLDRDGVINFDSPDYIKSVSEWRPIPGALDAIADLHHQGIAVSICTNQSGVARGLISMSALNAIHAALQDALTQRGAQLKMVSVCPHHPDENCCCRKPKPGMLLDQLSKLNVEPADALFVGDSLRDVQAACAARVPAALVRTGNGVSTEAALATQAQKAQSPDHRAGDQDRDQDGVERNGIEIVGAFDSLRDVADTILSLSLPRPL